MADRTGLGNTTLHYLAVRQAMVSVFRAYIRKSRQLTRLPRQTDRLFRPENGFQGAMKRQGGPFLGFAQVFSAIIVRKKTARTGSY